MGSNCRCWALHCRKPFGEIDCQPAKRQQCHSQPKVLMNVMIKKPNSRIDGVNRSHSKHENGGDTNSSVICQHNGKQVEQHTKENRSQYRNPDCNHIGGPLAPAKQFGNEPICGM